MTTYLKFSERVLELRLRDALISHANLEIAEVLRRSLPVANRNATMCCYDVATFLSHVRFRVCNIYTATGIWVVNR